MSQSEAGPYVFLSYSRGDREFAGRLAQALQNQGLHVWWDAEIPAGVHYPKYIEDGLKSAACVVVLWSAHSAASRWVRNEADWGAENATLVPLLIDDIEIPWEFRNFQTLDLSHWDGKPDDPAFRKLLQGLQGRLGASRAVPGAPEGPVGAPSVRQGAFSRSRDRSATGVARKRWFVPVGLLLAAALGIVLYSLSPLRPPRALEPAEETISFKPLTGDGLTHSSAISPDGKYLAYTRIEAGRTGLRLKQIETGSESTLVQGGARGIKSPIFSPDGVYVFFVMNAGTPEAPDGAVSNLYRISMLGGEPRIVTSGVVDRRFDCSPDGRRLVFKRIVGDSTRIMVVGTDGTGERQIAAGRHEQSMRHCIAWSADGAEVLTARRDSISGFLDLIALPVAGGTPRIVGGDPWQTVLDIRPLVDGSGLLVLGKPVPAVGLNINLWLLRTGAENFTALTNDVTMYYQVTSDRSCRNLALNYYGAKRTLRIIEMGPGGRVRDISTDLVANGRVLWAGDDRLLVNQSVGSRIGLVLVDVRDGTIRNVPTDVEYVAEMDLSTDRRVMAFRSYLGGGNAIWLANGDGSSPRNLTESGGDEINPQLAPDGRWLVYSRRDTPAKPWYIWKRSLVDGSASPLLDTPGTGPRISPDGTRLVAVFRDPTTGGSRLALASTAGGELQPVTVPDDHDLLCWNPDGSGFTSSSRAGGRLVIWDLPLSGGAPRQLAEFPANLEKITDAAWSPDGGSLAVCLEVAAYDALLLQRSGGAR
ncbi:MAG: TIR domain-containing protein [Krumholzibacteria bacterium]|nr:TIR domain-containing protein [Candidatus Krumholzibacteria bacterium]